MVLPQLRARSAKREGAPTSYGEPMKLEQPGPLRRKRPDAATPARSIPTDSLAPPVWSSRLIIPGRQMALPLLLAAHPARRARVPLAQSPRTFP